MHDVPDGHLRATREAGRSTASPGRPDAFTLHVGAALGPEWSEWLAASEVLARDDGSGLITAVIRDQAMLFGLLERIRDLGVPLLGLYPGCALRALHSAPCSVNSDQPRSIHSPDQGATP